MTNVAAKAHDLPDLHEDDEEEEVGGSSSSSCVSESDMVSVCPPVIAPALPINAFLGSLRARRSRFHRVRVMRMGELRRPLLFDLHDASRQPTATPPTRKPA